MAHIQLLGALVSARLKCPGLLLPRTAFVTQILRWDDKPCNRDGGFYGDLFSILPEQYFLARGDSIAFNLRVDEPSAEPTWDGASGAQLRPAMPKPGDGRQKHPRIELETGMYRFALPDGHRFELHWSRSPKLRRDDEELVGLEECGGCVQLLGALIAARLRSPEKLQPQDTLARMVLKPDGDCYVNISRALPKLVEVVGKDAFRIVHHAGVAFVLEVDGPPPVPDTMAGHAAHRTVESEPSAPHLPSMNTALGQGAQPPQPSGLPFQGGENEYEPWEQFLNPETWAQAAEPRESDRVRSVRASLISAIESSDEQAVHLHVWSPGVCTHEVVALARRKVFSGGPSAGVRILAVVEQVAGAGRLNSNTV